MARKSTDADGDRALRTATLFREVNERIDDVSTSFDSADADFFCECGDGRCTERVTLTLREYERVRANPARFVTALGHERAPLGRIVDVNERFSVVEADAADVLGTPFGLARTPRRARPSVLGDGAELHAVATAA